MSGQSNGGYGGQAQQGSGSITPWTGGAGYGIGGGSPSSFQSGGGMQRGINQMPGFGGGGLGFGAASGGGMTQPYQPGPATDPNQKPPMTGGPTGIAQQNPMPPASPPPGMVLDPTRQGGVRPWDPAGFDPTHGGPFYMPDPNANRNPQFQPQLRPGNGFFQPNQQPPAAMPVQGGPQTPQQPTNSPFGNFNASQAYQNWMQR